MIQLGWDVRDSTVVCEQEMKREKEIQNERGREGEKEREEERERELRESFPFVLYCSACFY